MKYLKFFILVLFLFLLSACGSTAKPASTGYTVTDVRGKTVTFKTVPKKVLTDSLHLDETVLTLVPVDYLAGAYYLDAEPGISFIAGETKAVEPKFNQLTPEMVVRLAPDVFFASQWSDPGLVAKVEELGIPVVMCYGPVTVQQIRDNVELMAKALQQETTGKKVLQQMDTELKTIERVIALLPQPRPVGLLVSLMSRYGGKGSLYDELCPLAGFRNGLREAGIANGQELTREGILRADPDFFLVSSPYPGEQEAYTKFQDSFFADPVLRGLKGLKRKAALPDKYVYDASPMVVYGIQAMANSASGRTLFTLPEQQILKGY